MCSSDLRRGRVNRHTEAETERSRAERGRAERSRQTVTERGRRTDSTSGPGVRCGQWGEVSQHVVHHAHFDLVLSQGNAHSSPWRNTRIDFKFNIFMLPERCVCGDRVHPPVCVCVCSPAGLTCLKEVAAGMPRAPFSSLTSCQAFRASHRLMKPGDPFTTEG